MCGILGFITDRPRQDNADNFFALLSNLQSRGGDATGVAIVKKDNSIRILKQPITADKFLEKHWEDLEKDVAESRIVIGHTRKWTQGKPEDNHNNHPIQSKKWVMIHNGGCSQMDRIKDYKYAGEVDSEILLSHIEVNGIEKAFEKLGWGSGAIALIPKDKRDRVVLVRHNEPTSIALNGERDTLFFASTEHSMKVALADIFDIFSTYQIRDTVEHIVYEVTLAPLNVAMTGKVEVKRESTVYRHHGGSYGYGGGGYYENDRGYWNGKTWTEKPAKGSASKSDEDLDHLSWSRNTLMWLASKLHGQDKTEPDKLDVAQLSSYSNDFANWTKIELANDKACWIDNSREFVKLADRDKKCHCIMRLDDAVKCGLLEIKL